MPAAIQVAGTYFSDRAVAGRYLERRGFSTGVILTILNEVDLDHGT